MTWWVLPERKFQGPMTTKRTGCNRVFTGEGCFLIKWFLEDQRELTTTVSEGEKVRRRPVYRSQSHMVMEELELWNGKCSLLFKPVMGLKPDNEIERAFCKLLKRQSPVAGCSETMGNILVMLQYKALPQGSLYQFPTFCVHKYLHQGMPSSATFDLNECQQALL